MIATLPSSELLQRYGLQPLTCTLPASWIASPLRSSLIPGLCPIDGSCEAVAMAAESLPAEAVVWYQRYVAWLEEYGPFNWIEFDSVGGPNYLRAETTDHRLLWTDYHNAENLMVSRGFHYWEKFEVHGWHVATTAWEDRDNATEYVQLSFFGKCECYDEESGAGSPDCEEFSCGGQGFRDYYFD